MQKYKFKVGDSVRVIQYTTSSDYPSFIHEMLDYSGKVFEVLNVNYSPTHDVNVYRLKGAESWSFSEKWLEHSPKEVMSND